MIKPLIDRRDASDNMSLMLQMHDEFRTLGDSRTTVSRAVPICYNYDTLSL